MVNPLDAGGTPFVKLDALPPMEQEYLVQIPIDPGEIHMRGVEHAMRWRLSVRAAITNLLERGYRVTRFVRARSDAGSAPDRDRQLPYYVFTRFVNT
jgi:predicted GNAT superfamily acetyltransferase